MSNSGLYLKLKHKKFKQLLKAVSLLIITSLSLNTLTWAFESPQAGLPSFKATTVKHLGKSITIPEKFGTIADSYQGGKQTVLCIQDLHCHYEVQKNIAAIISHLNKRHDLKLIGEEGGYGTLNMDVVKDFPIKDVRQAVSDHYVKQGRLTGAEYFIANHEGEVYLEGVESEKLYKDSYAAIQTFLNAESQGYCFDLRDSLEEIKSYVYNTALYQYDQKRVDYRNGDLDLLKYAVFLKKSAKQFNLDLSSYGQYQQFVSLNQAHFTSEIDAPQLLREIDHIDYQIRDQLYTDPVQEEMDQLINRLDIIEKLLNISVTPEELNKFRKKRDAYQVKAYLDFIKKYDQEAVHYFDNELYGLDEKLKKVEEFYELADKRSEAFVAHILDEMKKKNQSISLMVNGGFHSEKITEELKARNISFVTIKPTMTRQDIVNPYFNLLQGKKSPLERLLAQNQHIFAPEVAPMRPRELSTATESALKPMALLKKKLGTLSQKNEAALAEYIKLHQIVDLVVLDSIADAENNQIAVPNNTLAFTATIIRDDGVERQLPLVISHKADDLRPKLKPEASLRPIDDFQIALLSRRDSVATVVQATVPSDTVWVLVQDLFRAINLGEIAQSRWKQFSNRVIQSFANARSSVVQLINTTISNGQDLTSAAVALNTEPKVAGLAIASNPLFQVAVGTLITIGSMIWLGTNVVESAIIVAGLGQLQLVANGNLAETITEEDVDEVLKENWEYFADETKKRLAAINSASIGINKNRKRAELVTFLDRSGRIIDEALWQDPVENKYAIKKAVALLNKEERELLGDVVEHGAWAFKNSTIPESLLLMLNKVPKDWAKRHTKNLKGRKIYALSAENTYIGGGLGYVMQVHGRFMKALLGDNPDVHIATLETRYRKYKDVDGKVKVLDYMEHGLNKSIGLTQVGREFEIDGVKVRIMRGYRADDGMEVNLLDEVVPAGKKGRFTELMYDYYEGKEPNAEDHVNPATWDDYSAFYAQAGIRAIEILEEQRREQEPDTWEAPVIWGNDAQTAGFFPHLRKLRDDGHEIFKDAFLTFTTHTFGNRQYWYKYHQIPEMMRIFRIPEKYKSALVSGYNEIDLSGMAIELADFVNTVSRKQRHVVAPFNPDARLISFTNADDIQRAKDLFNKYYKELFGTDCDFDALTPQTVEQVKKAAARALSQKMENMGKKLWAVRQARSRRLFAATLKLATGETVDFNKLRQDQIDAVRNFNDEQKGNTLNRIWDARHDPGQADVSEYFAAVFEIWYNRPCDVMNLSDEEINGTIAFHGNFINRELEQVGNAEQARAFQNIESWNDETIDIRWAAYSTEQKKQQLREMGMYIDPKLPIAYYAGRAVDVKLGLVRAMSLYDETRDEYGNKKLIEHPLEDSNLFKLLKDEGSEAKNIVFFAREQAYEESWSRIRRLRVANSEFTAQRHEGQGNMAGVWSFKDQDEFMPDKLLLLLAGDLAFLDSDDVTGTCEYTEVNASSLFGLVLSPPFELSIPVRLRLIGQVVKIIKKNIMVYGEGIIGMQGIFKKDGEDGGTWNTIKPKSQDPDAYLNELRYILNKVGGTAEEKANIYSHMIQSFRLSHILDGNSTGAAYLTGWDSTIGNIKAEKAKAKEIASNLASTMKRTYKDKGERTTFAKGILTNGRNREKPFEFLPRAEDGIEQTKFGTYSQADGKGLKAFNERKQEIETERWNALIDMLKSKNFYNYIDDLLRGVEGHGEVMDWLAKLHENDRDFNWHQRNDILNIFLKELEAELKTLLKEAETEPEKQVVESTEEERDRTAFNIINAGQATIFNRETLKPGIEMGHLIKALFKHAEKNKIIDEKSKQMHQKNIGAVTLHLSNWRDKEVAGYDYLDPNAFPDKKKYIVIPLSSGRRYAVFPHPKPLYQGHLIITRMDEQYVGNQAFLNDRDNLQDLKELGDIFNLEEYVLTFNGTGAGATQTNHFRFDAIFKRNTKFPEWYRDSKYFSQSLPGQGEVKIQYLMNAPPGKMSDDRVSPDTKINGKPLFPGDAIVVEGGTVEQRLTQAEAILDVLDSHNLPVNALRWVRSNGLPVIVIILRGQETVSVANKNWKIGFHEFLGLPVTSEEAIFDAIKTETGFNTLINDASPPASQFNQVIQDIRDALLAIDPLEKKFIQSKQRGGTIGDQVLTGMKKSDLDNLMAAVSELGPFEWKNHEHDPKPFSINNATLSGLVQSFQNLSEIRWSQYRNESLLFNAKGRTEENRLEDKNGGYLLGYVIYLVKQLPGEKYGAMLKALEIMSANMEKARSVGDEERMLEISGELMGMLERLDEYQHIDLPPDNIIASTKFRLIGAILAIPFAAAFIGIVDAISNPLQAATLSTLQVATIQSPGFLAIPELWIGGLLVIALSMVISLAIGLVIRGLNIRAGKKIEVDLVDLLSTEAGEAAYKDKAVTEAVYKERVGIFGPDINMILKNKVKFVLASKFGVIGHQPNADFPLDQEFTTGQTDFIITLPFGYRMLLEEKPTTGVIKPALYAIQSFIALQVISRDLRNYANIVRAAKGVRDGLDLEQAQEFGAQQLLRVPLSWLGKMGDLLGIGFLQTKQDAAVSVSATKVSMLLERYSQLGGRQSIIEIIAPELAAMDLRGYTGSIDMIIDAVEAFTANDQTDEVAQVQIEKMQQALIAAEATKDEDTIRVVRHQIAELVITSEVMTSEAFSKASTSPVVSNNDFLFTMDQKSRLDLADAVSALLLNQSLTRAARRELSFLRRVLNRGSVTTEESVKFAQLLATISLPQDMTVSTSLGESIDGSAISAIMNSQGEVVRQIYGGQTVLTYIPAMANVIAPNKEAFQALGTAQAEQANVLVMPFTGRPRVLLAEVAGIRNDLRQLMSSPALAAAIADTKSPLAQAAYAWHTNKKSPITQRRLARAAIMVLKAEARAMGEDVAAQGAFQKSMDAVDVFFQNTRIFGRSEPFILGSIGEKEYHLPKVVRRGGQLAMTYLARKISPDFIMNKALEDDIRQQRLMNFRIDSAA